MSKTEGINHLGLTVRDLAQTTAFFHDVLSWEVTARDESYPRTTVTDGNARLTLWQADLAGPMNEFDRRTNIGLHHLALTVSDEGTLNALFEAARDYPGVKIEFAPEFMGSGPRIHTIFTEPGGLRIELVWAGQD